MNIRELLIKIGVNTGDSTGELDRVDKATERVKNGFAALNGVIAGLFAGGALMKLVDTAEGMQNLSSRMQAVTGSAEGAAAALAAIHASANETGIGIGDMGDTVARIIPAVQDFGMSAEDSVKIATNLTAALKQNGASAAEAGAVVTQFSQALGSGVLQGDELRSIMEGAPNLYRDMAKAMHVSIGEFKKMSSQGKITSAWLADFMLKNDKYRQQLKDMPKGIDFAWNTIKNDVSTAIGEMNEKGKVLASIGTLILSKWENLKDWVSEFVTASGGLANVVQNIKQVLTPLAALLGILLAFKAVAMLTSPIGIILSLATAIGVLYNDYMTWKEGGEALIDWDKWEPAIQKALAACDWLITKFKEWTGETNNAKAAIEAIGMAIGAVFAAKTAAMIANIATSLAGVTNAAANAGGAVGRLGTAIGALGRGLGIVGAVGGLAYAYADAINENSGRKSQLSDNGLYYEDSWVGNMVKGRLPWDFGGNKDAAGQSSVDMMGIPRLAAGNTPTNASNTTNVTNTDSSSHTYNVTIQAPEGANGAQLAEQFHSRITDLERQNNKGGFDPHLLEMTHGAK
ncbi:tape measure protein [Salmonella enterica]|nr:tape measure protein [Salmonella enterica]